MNNWIGQTIVTQKRVADAAAVSQSTVSLALRNDPRVPGQTRQRIQAVARRLGYSSNPLVSMLMSRVQRRDLRGRGAIAYLCTAPQHNPAVAGWVQRNYLAGARKRAEELGYSLDPLYLDGERLSGPWIAGVLRTRGIAGIVIHHVPGPCCPERRLPFDIGQLALVSIGAPLAHPQLHYVANDQYMRAIVAARELLALGYRRLGLVLCNDKFDALMAHRCSAGFLALGQFVGEMVTLPILRLPGKEKTRPLRDWLRSHRPEAVLTDGGHLIELIQKLGLRAPDDLGLAQLDWKPHYGPAAGVYGNSERVGGTAVEVVVAQIHRGESGPPALAISHLVAGSWVAGTTVRKVGAPLDLDASFFSALARP